MVNLFLGLAIDDEGDRLGELEVRPGVERGELLALQLETDGHHTVLRHRPALGIAGDAGDLRVLEDRDIKVCGLFGLGVEPQEWMDLLHVGSL
jgi:hypothetical protein